MSINEKACSLESKVGDVNIVAKVNGKGAAAAIQQVLNNSISVTAQKMEPEVQTLILRNSHVKHITFEKERDIVKLLDSATV